MAGVSGRKSPAAGSGARLVCIRCGCITSGCFDARSSELVGWRPSNAPEGAPYMAPLLAAGGGFGGWRVRQPCDRTALDDVGAAVDAGARRRLEGARGRDPGDVVAGLTVRGDGVAVLLHGRGTGVIGGQGQLHVVRKALQQALEVR